MYFRFYFFKRREFGRINKVFPFYEITGWRPFAKNYRLTVGITEVVCGAILVLIPGKLFKFLSFKKNSYFICSGRLKQLANFVLLVVMLGAVYTHYALHDKFDRMAPGLVFSLLLVTRLIIHRQVSQREKRSQTQKKTTNSSQEEEENDEMGQESEDQESQNDNEEKQKPSSDKKKEKKNK